MVEHNHDEAIRFLKWHSERGPWTLTAIPPDGGRTYTCQFDADTQDDCRTWLDQQGTKQNNIYFMVNPPLGHLKEKAMKEHVKEMAWLHIDLDYKGNGDPTAGLAAIKDKLDRFYSPPTVTVFSGGGYQAFWRLSTPVYVGGEVPKCEEMEAYNIQLSVLLGGDHCHNLDRIMRLPGTVNYPTASKRKRGRVDVLAAIVGDLTERAYDLSEFKAAPRSVSGQRHAGSTIRGITLPDHIPKTLSMDELGLDVKDRTKALIVQGHDPTDANAHESRSEAVWAVICDLLRAKVADDIIAGILLDKDFGISAHIHDQPRPVDYTARQIGRAKEKAFHPALCDFNDRFAVVKDGGKARVLYEDRDEIDHRRIVYRTQSFQDFRDLHMNKFVTVGTDSNGNVVEKPAGSWWLAQPSRRQFEGVRFLPTKPEEHEGYFNLWRGFKHEPKPGDWGLLRSHIEDNIARSGGEKDEAVFKYILDWMAFAVQHPDKPAEVAIVMQGKMGTGKGILGRAMVELFGQHGRQVTSSDQIVGALNGHLRDCVMLFCDEAIAPGDAKATAKLKALITEPTISIEGKGKDIVTAPNYTHAMIASNDEAVVPAGEHERRYLSVEVSDQHMQDQPYFAEIQTQLDDGGYAALLHDLLQRDIVGWHPRQNVPHTDTLRDQQHLNLGLVDSLLLALLERGELPASGYRYDSDKSTRKRSRLDSRSAYSDDLQAYAKKCVPDMERWPEQKLGRVFGVRGFKCKSDQVDGLRVWRFPKLSEMRAAWEKRFNGWDWQEPSLEDWRSVAEQQHAGESQYPFPIEDYRRNSRGR